ncbi:MAG TPA: DNA primase [Alphaproteobacteria bacterium]|nr:DNA primase [Alphaproteobacteria bacterium]
MSFPPSFLDELRARLTLSSIVGRRVRLQRRGREHLGLCPFHNEKTPSFTVNDDKAFFHCFGCGAHGDVISFVMRTEGLGFPEAVERCAQEAGLEVPATSPQERAKAERQATLHAALEAAADWFERQLQGPEGRGGLAYLRERGLSDEAIARFRLGFAPDSRGALKTALIRQGVPEPLLLEAGLLIRPPEDNPGPTYDRFRRRIIFPIADRRGRIIAFGGRILGEGEPKYLNSPETPLFHKGRTLYGLAQARKPAQEKGEVIVAEGYMDVIAMSEGGFANTVAPLGTALTEEHLRQLWRLAPEPILCFDGDAAGQRAAARAAERALPHLVPGFSLRFALLPAGLDPDDLIRSQGAQPLAEILGAAEPLVDRIWALEAASRRLDTPERRAGFRAALRARVGVISDPTVRRDYAAEMERRLEGQFGTGRERQERRRPRASGPTFAGGEAARRGVAGLIRRQQEILLATLINHPELLAECAEEAARLGFPGPLDKLRQALLNLCARTPDLDSGELKRQLSNLGLGDALAHLMGGAVADHASFARAEAPLEAARRGWTEAVRRYRDLEERGEIELAGRLAEDMNEQQWDTLRRRIAALEETASRDVDAEF